MGDMRHRAELNVGSEDTDLTRLLASEATLERLLTDARAEAARLLADAAATAAERERGLDSQLQQEAAALRARLDGERVQREAELEAAATADVGRYEGISDARVAAMAERVVARLVGAA